jgi:ABC-type sugar transport system permease subunit
MAPVAWLLDPDLAMTPLVVTDPSQKAPLAHLILLAALYN